MFVDDDAWRSPSPKLWEMRCVEVIALGIVTIIVVGVSLTSLGAVIAVGSVAAAVACTGAALGFVHNRFRSWRYTERDEDLVVARGVMFRRMTVVPYGRMQFVDVTAGPIERMFGLATVKLHTAAAATDARIPGLDHDEASRLRDRLASLGEAKAAGL
jgi:uncharacterized protein